MKFYQTRSPDEPVDFQSHRDLEIQAFQNINVGEELYCDYGNSYNLNTYLIKLHFVD